MYPSDLKKNQAGVCSGCVLWIGMARPPREVAFGVLFRVSFCVSVGLILCFSWFQLVSFCVSFCFSWSPGRAYEFCNCSRCDSAWSSFPSPCQPQLRHGAGKFGARKGVLAALRRRRKTSLVQIFYDLRKSHQSIRRPCISTIQRVVAARGRSPPEIIWSCPIDISQSFFFPARSARAATS